MGNAKPQLKTDDMRAIADDLPDDGRCTAMMLRDAANELDERRRLDRVIDDPTGHVEKISRADLIAYLVSHGWCRGPDRNRMSSWSHGEDDHLWVYESCAVDEGKIRQLAACERRPFVRVLADLLDIAHK